MAAIRRDDDQLLASDSDDDDYIPESQSAAKPTAPVRGSRKGPTGLVFDQDSDEEDAGEEGGDCEAAGDDKADDEDGEDDADDGGDADDEVVEGPLSSGDGSDKQGDDAEEEVEKGDADESGIEASRPAKRPRVEGYSAQDKYQADQIEGDRGSARNGDTLERTSSVQAGVMDEALAKIAENTELVQKPANGDEYAAPNDKPGSHDVSNQEATRVMTTKVCTCSRLRRCDVLRIGTSSIRWIRRRCTRRDESFVFARNDHECVELMCSL
jgi:hypothetical protein